MAQRSEEEYPLSNPTVIEGAPVDNAEEFVSVPHSWAPSGSGPMGIPRSSSRQSPASTASSSFSSSRFAPHTFGPSSVSSSYSRYANSGMSSGPVPISGPSRSFKARAKRDLPRESPSSRRSILSSLLQQQQQQPPSSSSSTTPTFTTSRSRRQSTNSFASDSDCSPYFGATITAPPDWRPPFPSSAATFTSGVSRTHVSTSSRARYGPIAAPKSIMPCVQQLESSKRPAIDLINHDVSDMLNMIAAVLRHVLSDNDTLYAPDGRGNPLPSPPVKSEEGTQMRTTLLSFHGCIIPAISQKAYLSRILKYCPLTNEVFLASLIYFDRISYYAHQLTVQGAPIAPGTAPALFILDSYNVHRLIIAAITVASKFFSDIFYKNSRYAQVGGLPVDELNNLELQFLIIIKFNLMITLEEFQAYADYVQDFYAQFADEDEEDDEE